jgi:exopolysaccharide biosynthesis polyprenyl glycosylphosphotransferase
MGFGTQRPSRHLRWAGFLFLADFLLVWISFLLGILVRFEEFSWDKLINYGPGVGLASVILPAVLYIGGLYSPRYLPSDKLRHARWLAVALIATVAAALATGSIVFTSRIGRGVLVWAVLFLVPMLFLRHWFVMSRRKRRIQSMLCLVAGDSDERAAGKLYRFWGNRTLTFGIVLGRGYESVSDLPVVGRVEDLRSGGLPDSFDVVLVRDNHFQDPVMASFLRELRYNGSEILPLSDACEDIYHAVPIELITDAWLFRASNQSQLFYVRKLKRFSDVVLAALFLVLLSPFLAIGALIVRLCSPGPVIFRQERAGRLGRSVTVLKLRTMHLESGGQGKERWATEEKARIFPLGQFLRTFRIDEIPQLINVLRGEMSFVGPRPEQLTIVDELSLQIPFYRERLLIQPGITGWAQVNYPYGASVEDAARKLEYDLYYMKHMGIFLDFFILLETVKIILCGGRKAGDHDYLKFREDLVFAVEEEPRSPHSDEDLGEKKVPSGVR